MTAPEEMPEEMEMLHEPEEFLVFERTPEESADALFKGVP